MAFPYQAQFNLSYATVGAQLQNAKGMLLNAGDSIAAEDFANAGYYLNLAGTYIGNVSDAMYSLGDSVWYHTAMIFDWIVGNLDGEPPVPYELTYQKIVEAWGANDFEGRTVTIAFIDRMRQLIWDEPFNVVWAAKPES